MADHQKISSLTGQVEYDVAGKQIVSAVNAQVEYDIPGNQKVSHVSAQVEYQGDKWQQNASLTNRHLADTSDLIVDHTFNAHNLTASASAPTADSGDKKEGINSAVYAKASSQYHYITDANLKSGFPLKNGDTVKQGTWTCWVKFNTLTGSQTLIAKENYQNASTRTLQLDMVTSTLTAYWFYNTSNGYDTLSIASGFVTGRWYHIAISFDGVNKYLNYRIWDDTAGSVVSAGSFDSGSFGGALNISDGVLSLGAAYDPAARANYLDGKLNAVHVFNRMLGWKEIDAIRSGTWTKQEDYVGLDVSQVQAQVEYDTFQAQRVYQVQAQVEVDDVVSYTSQLLAQVEYEETPNIYTSQLIVQVEYTPAISFSASINPSFRTQVLAASSHRWWRILTNTSTGTYCGVAEYELHNNFLGEDLTGSGTATASTYAGGCPPSDAVDNNNSTIWATWPSSAPQWWQYDFGVGNSYGIIEVKITARITYFTEAGSSISLQYSDNGVDFTTQETVTGLTWTSDNEIKTLDFSAPVYSDLNVETSKSFTASIGAGFSSNSDADILSERLLVGSVASSVSTSEPDLSIRQPVNNFTGASNCVSLYKFENGNLTVDSKGTNTLTAINTPTADLNNVKEDFASVSLDRTSGQSFVLHDGGDFAPHSLISSSQDPWAVTTSSEYNTTTLANWRIFNGNNTYWVTNSTQTGWIKLDLGSRTKRKLGSYAIHVNEVPEPNRAPKDFTLQGSNDNSNWDVLDTQTNQTSWSNGEKRTFNLSSPSAAYRYFKLDVTANNGDTFLQCRELYLYAPQETSNNFPLRNGDITQTGTWCFWYRPTELTTLKNYWIAGKHDASSLDEGGLVLGRYADGNLNTYWTYGTAGNQEVCGIYNSLVINRWYHISLAFDGVNKTLAWRIWDATAGSVVASNNYTFTNELHVSGSSFAIGSAGQFNSTAYTAHGNIDEFVIFNTILSSDDIDLIRSGQYSGTSAPEGSIVWGQITGVVENIHSFASSWTGTGEVVNTGDGEEIELEDGEYMECSPVNTGTQQIEIIKDGY